MRSNVRRAAIATTRTAGQVLLAMLLILVILPAVLAAQAASVV